VLQLESNLDQVIGRFRRHREMVPVAFARAAHPTRWRERLRQDAERTLQALAAPHEQRFIPAFLSTLTAAVIEGGMVIRMESPGRWFLAAQPSLFANPVNTTGPRYERPETQRWTNPGPANTYEPVQLAAEDYDRFFELVHQWVEEEKRWDAEIDRDKNPKTVAEKAMFITRLLLSPDLTDAEARARDLLLPHILDFIRRQTETSGRLAPETAALWLRAVLMQWTATVIREYPEQVRAELHLLKRGTRSAERAA
jgi:hypothetical protein